ncbi:MAG TPA: class I SAM-dependent methyltransferase, partial [Tepidisphaeraceae bacterium]|nr:class I SAM-dependent methyltransferase [Tepidisphaeraceae bacterium]
DLTPVATEHTICKCCKSPAPLLGVVDFNKNCEDRRRPPMPLSGIPIYYYACRRCGMIFTNAFDSFTKEDFATHIYNAGYGQVDPDYASSRPAGNAQFVAAAFKTSPDISILDYGGGNGALAAHLRSAGFSDVTTFDPFVSAHAERPNRQFDVITSFEVLEHSNTPAHTLDEITGFLKPEGLLIFSTLLIPADIAAIGVAWWYIAPRNGHVTLYTGTALQMMFGARGLRCGSKDSNIHAAWKKIPECARHFIRD